VYYRVWCSALVVLAEVVWSWVTSCVHCVKFTVEQFHTVHTACDPAPHNLSQHNQCRTPYAVVHGLVLLMMGIIMPETWWDRSFIMNIRLFASCWFLSLHLTNLRMYGALIPLSSQSIRALSCETRRHITLSFALNFKSWRWNVCYSNKQDKAQQSHPWSLNLKTIIIQQDFRFSRW